MQVNHGDSVFTMVFKASEVKTTVLIMHGPLHPAMSLQCRCPPPPGCSAAV